MVYSVSMTESHKPALDFASVNSEFDAPSSVPASEINGYDLHDPLPPINYCGNPASNSVCHSPVVVAHESALVV